MIKRLVCLGSVIIDVVLDVPHLPERGGDVLAARRTIAAGGGFNVLSAAARLGLPGVYVGPHGTGAFGDQVRTALAAEQIDVALKPNPDLDTGWTLALVEPDGERTFVTVTGADAVVESDSLRTIRYRAGDAVYFSGYDLAYPGAGAAVAEHLAGLPGGLMAVLDPGPLVGEIVPGRLADALGRVDFLSLNERELDALGGLDALSEALHAGATIVVRQGARGATIHAGRSKARHVPAIRVEAVDTSGAGDVHVGACLAGLANGMSWPEAVLSANRAAAFAVSRSGSAAGPTLAQLEEFSKDSE